MKSNKATIVTYKNIPQDGYNDDLQIEFVELVGLSIVKPQIFPGKKGYPDIYINHYKFFWGYLITYSYQPLTSEQVKAIEQRVKEQLGLL